jgi:ABC-2 type transport system ATP-binding protein
VSGVNSMSALEVEGVTKSYRRGAKSALSDVRLAVPRGAFVALVGPNGAGKSTLLRCCIGFEKVSAGAIRVLGVDPQRDRTSALGLVGYVAQSPGLYRDLTSADHLHFAAASRRDFDISGTTQRLTGLGISIDVPTRELSGGQQAQVAVSLALGTRAPLLLLDEPLASLDPLARHDVLRLIAAAVRDEEATVVLSSHVVGDLESVCDRVIILAPATVMLDASIAVVRQHHAVLRQDDVAGHDVVGSFTDSGGVRRALVRWREPAATLASLEEVVLGYLAAARNRDFEVRPT